MSLPLTTTTDPTTVTPDAATCNSATCSDPTFIFSDHLGSTSTTTDVEGNLVSETRYDPWGKVRYASGLTPTDYTYTDQYSYMDDPTTAASEGFGLMFYNARWYDPGLGRFTQADTIVPLQSQGVQAWDRYAFVNNNPVRYNDPTGHRKADSANDKGNNNNDSSTCDPKTDKLCYSEEEGLCVPGLGCSGGEVYREWWVNDYLPMMDDFLLQDIATVTQFLADPLNLGLDAYENWRGIPLPKKYGFGIDFFTQLLKDSSRSDLSVYQKFGRAGLNGAEGMVTSSISSAAGVAVGDAALAVSFGPAVETVNLVGASCSILGWIYINLPCCQLRSRKGC